MIYLPVRVVDRRSGCNLTPRFKQTRKTKSTSISSTALSTSALRVLAQEIQGDKPISSGGNSLAAGGERRLARAGRSR
jgi:hypothetical protein